VSPTWRAAPGLFAAVGAMMLGVTVSPALAIEPDQPSDDPILVWNDQTNRAIQATSTDPFRASRALALESIAVLDTVRSIAGAPGFLVRLPGSRDLSPDIAVAAAAHAMLGHLFPERQAALDAVLSASLADKSGPVRNRSVAFGKAVADAVFARRENDGWNAKGGVETVAAPGQWRPTPPDFLPPRKPQWGDVTPFVLTRPSQFRPPGPPAPASAAFREAAASVASLGAAQSIDRTADQTEIARYWSDAAGTVGPAGHWNAIAASLVAPSGMSMEAEAELFAELNIAIADAGIAAADAMYRYRFWRPITAIHEGAAGAPPNSGWSPLLSTPNDPSYISAHSSFSGAAATILTTRLGSREFSFGGAGDPGGTRTFTSFQQAAEEAAAAPSYGGINYPFDTLDGLATGQSVGTWASKAFHRIAEDRGPVIILNHPTDKQAWVGSGFALDNFSPVKTITVKVDGGDRFNVAVDDKGRFALPRLRRGQFGQSQATLVAISATGRTATARLMFDGAAVGSVVTTPLTVE
jgi:hypothetical protein